jgi:hypothetical protein
MSSALSIRVFSIAACAKSSKVLSIARMIPPDKYRAFEAATVKRYFREIHDELRTHLRDFVDACNFAL